jgi:hypothetical protein
LYVTRREALVGLVAMPTLVGAHRPSTGTLPSSSAALGDLALSLRRCSRYEVVDVGARALGAGAAVSDLLGAAFQAGVVDIRPRHVGGKLHAVLMVESVFQLAEATDRRSAALLALWNLDDFKASQQLDREEGDWVLPARPDVSFATEEAARREFVAAMEAWDDDRADRALVGLLPHHDRDSLFEILWPLAARSYVDIGHKMIFAAQTARVLGRIAWPTAEPALRSLVNGLLFRPSGPETDAFERSRRLAAGLPSGWAAGRDDASQTLPLLARLRGADSEGAQKTVAAALAGGLGTGTVWDALRLGASELFLRRPLSEPASDRGALLPVHAVTVTNALGYAWRTSRSDANRRVLLLQAAGWLPQLRDDLARIVGLAPEARAIDTLGRDERAVPERLEDLPVRPTPAVMHAYLRDPDRRATLRARLVEDLAGKAVEHHQHKYAAAVFEESRLVDPRWASHLLACAVPYLPGRAAPDTELAARSRAALRTAGF